MTEAVGASRTCAELAREAHEAAAKRAQIARVRVSLFSESDGGVAAARERCVYLEAVARRAECALARVIAGRDEGAQGPRGPLHAHVTVGDDAVRGVTAMKAVLDARAFDTTRQLTHALPPGVFAALPLAHETRETRETDAKTSTKRVSSSVQVRRESYADAVAKDVQNSIVAQAQRLEIGAS
jgi:hypothetical protein